MVTKKEQEKEKKRREEALRHYRGYDVTEEEYRTLTHRPGYKPVTEKVKEIRAAEAAAGGGVGVGGVGTLPPPRNLREQAERQQEQVEATQPIVQRAGELTESIQEAIEEKPSLEPPPLTETTAEIGLGVSVGIGNIVTAGIEQLTGKEFGRTSSAELAKTTPGKFLGNAILGVGTATVAGLGMAGYAALAQTAAAKSIAASVGFKASTLANVGFGVGAIFGVKSLLDLERDDISVARNIISGMVEEGERIEADVRNGLDPNLALDRLEDMAVEIETSESVIKQKAQYNFKYRNSDEYRQDEQAIIKSREALRRRARAVANIAETGTAALNPEALFLNIMERERELNQGGYFENE